MNNNTLPLNLFKLKCHLFIGYREEKFFWGNRYIGIALDAAEDHFPFVSFEKVSFIGNLLKQPCTVTFAVGEYIFPVNDWADYQNNDQRKNKDEFFHLKIELKTD